MDYSKQNGCYRLLDSSETRESVHIACYMQYCLMSHGYRAVSRVFAPSWLEEDIEFYPSNVQPAVVVEV
jgi:hypothetical protein